MNIKDLANLDIKDIRNIDYSALLGEFKKRPDIIAEVLTIMITIIVCLHFFGANRSEFSELSQGISILQQKTAIYDEFQESQKLLKSLKSVLPAAISESQLIDIITKTAQQSGLKIESVSPAVETDQKAYSTLTVTLNMTTTSYKKLWDFIYRLENSHRTLRIDKWSLDRLKGSERVYRRRASVQEALTQNPNMLKTSITITAINFKNE